MKTRSLVCTLIFGLALALTSAFGQTILYAPGNVGGWSDVQQFAQYSAHTTNAVPGSGAQSVTLDNCYIAIQASQQQFFPLAVGVSVDVLDAAGNSEVVVISSISSPVPAFGSASPGFTCGFTGTFAHAHATGVKIVSADGGLGEAVTILKGAGGTVVVSPLAGITSATIIALTVGAYNVGIVDNSGINSPSPVSYCWNGTTYMVCSGAQTSVNGAGFVPFTAETNVTLATTQTTTAVGGASFIPANSVILGVTGRVTTAITGSCTGWEIGDATTAARFTVNKAVLTAGTTVANTGAYLTTAIAVAATGFTIPTAEALQITCAGGNPSAGAIRVSVFGYTVIPAAQ